MGPLPRVICGVPSIACAPSQLRDVRRVPFPHPAISPGKMRTVPTTHIRSTHDDDTEQNMAFPTIQPSVYTYRQGESRDGCLCMIATSRSRAETMRVQTTNDDVACFFRSTIMRTAWQIVIPGIICGGKWRSRQQSWGAAYSPCLPYFTRPEFYPP